jgi:tetratricopeptide (TPR) repeat protein
MEKLYQADTADVEARTFYALSLLGLNEGDRDVATYRKAYELVAPVFRAHPKHPGAAHYLIHAVDDPEHAGLGLDAANAYGRIAPDAAHALHMTSHIYLALGRWDDVLAANLKAHATIPNGRLSGHGSHWIEYSLIQLGRYRDADHWLDSMTRQARTGPERFRSDSWNAAVIMAAANLVDTHRYNRKAAFIHNDPKYFGPESYSEAIVDLGAAIFGQGLAALQRGERDTANAALAEMEKLRTSAGGDAMKATSRGYVEVMQKTLRGYVAWKDGKRDDALAMFDDAARQEAALPMPFGPPVVIKPPRESRGELLLEMKRPAEAKAEFDRALARTPLRTAPLLGLARAEKALGHRAVSRKYYREVLTIWHGADSDVPELSEVRAGSR